MGKNQYHNKSLEELYDFLNQNKRQLMNLRFRLKTRNLDTPHLIALSRKEIARIKTAINASSNVEKVNA